MYTISQLAKAANVPTTTIRYYERIGLLKPEDRSVGNYRLYTEASLQMLKFIRAGQESGFTLEDIRVLLVAEEDEIPCCCDVQPLIEQRLEDVKQKLAKLHQVQRVLQSALRKCKRSRPNEPCHVVASLQKPNA
ncbi:MAG: helix-turn-helix domain-containing protein [Planctomycetaceae bacterium]